MSQVRMEDGSNKTDKMMKKLYHILVALAALCTVLSCQKEDIKDSVANDLVGEWHLEETETDGMVIDPLSDVYLIINSDCTFIMYQKSGDQKRYTRFTGTCKTTQNILSGEYSDGTRFGSDYEFSISGDTLTLITADGLEIQTWIRESLDQNLKNEADVKTRSVLHDVIPFL